MQHCPVYLHALMQFDKELRLWTKGKKGDYPGTRGQTLPKNVNVISKI
jgi:hypothetical protein